MLGKIDARLREAKGNNLFCGGLTVILVGPIPAISIRSDDTRAVRIQFPLRLAYAMTVWKSQGETLGKTVVDIGPKESAGLTFFALSRVRNISDLAVLPFDYQRALKISTGDGLFARKMEERRLNMLGHATHDQWFANNHPLDVHSIAAMTQSLMTQP